MTHTFRTALASLLAPWLLCLGCAAFAQTSAPVAIAATTSPVSSSPAPTQADYRRDYVIGPGDVLRISVYQNTDLSLDARVSETGVISYPLLGSVPVGGLSIAQAEKAIADGLRTGNFIKQPQVNVLLMQVRGNQASVLGMVNKPGRYPIEVTGMRMSELLAQAGGVAQGGSDVVTLSGTRNGQSYRLQVDIAALFAAGSNAQDPVVLNGDTLYVDRMPTIYVYGEVQRPGPIRLEAGMTLMQAVASGGGLTQRGTERGIRVNRRTPDGKLEVLHPKMDDTLQLGDVVYVRESLF